MSFPSKEGKIITMFPTLFQLGAFSLQTINIWLLIGFIGGGFLVWKRAHDEHYEDDQVFDVLLVSTLIGILFARVVYVLFHFTDFGIDFLSWLSFFTRPGFNEFIGVIATLVAARWQLKHRKWDEYEFLDFLSVGCVWFLACLWIGRFFAGSYLGLPTGLPVGMIFPTVYDARHPVQLYFVGILLLQLLILFLLEKRYRFFQWYKGNSQSAQTGFVVGNMIFLTGITYTALRFLQQEPQKFIFSFPIEAIATFLLGCIGLVLLYLRSGIGKSNKRTVKLKQQRRLFSRKLKAFKWRKQSETNKE